MELRVGRAKRMCAIYEPTGDLRRVARRLQRGDKVRAYGGVRRPSRLHPKILNVERFDLLGLAGGRPRRDILRGTYIASPRANRHLTKPLTRFGNEVGGRPSPAVEEWLDELRRPRVLVRSR